MAASLAEALAEFQADPPVLTKNKAGHQSKYADLVQVNEKVLSRLNGLGVIFTSAPTMLDDGKFVLEYELEHVASGTKKGGRYPLKLAENPQQMGSAITYARRYVLQSLTSVAAEDEDDDGQAALGHRTAQRAQARQQQRPAGEGRPTAQRAQRQTRPAAVRPPLPGEDPPDPDGKVGPDQHRAMHALWRELGYGGDDNREQRLAITAKILGLPDLDSSADLTRGQAATVIDALRARKERMAGGEPS